MLSQSVIEIHLKNALPEVEIKAWTTYLDYYLFRVEYPDPFEKDWDPFFSVDNVTGEVCEFSVLTDITTSEFAKLEWTEV